MLAYVAEDVAPQNDAVPFQEQRYSQNVSVVDTDLKDEGFYCFLLAMRATSKLLEKAMNWNEGCDCHLK